ncbi:MAG: HipA domain-containing protein, partial [Gammaproteobacteria bacterium]|nr:HipA domain-containing protein [Gammaproteobacteria bacterium]
EGRTPRAPQAEGSSFEGRTPRAPQAEGSYLAKFNRLSGDPYNNARVELACLNMARAVGLNVVEGRVVSGVNGRDVLLLNRFDLTPGGNRRHLLTVNALLKERATQRDSGLVFRYDDVSDLLSRYSVAIEADLKQLVRLAMFNRAINNTDDHSRNFSLINDGEGYRLSPAYDLVPQPAMGEYHAAGFSHQPNPPKPSEISGAGRMFGLSTTWLCACADEVIAGIDRWSEFAEQAGVDESEHDRLRRLFNP